MALSNSDGPVKTFFEYTFIVFLLVVGFIKIARNWNRADREREFQQRMAENVKWIETTNNTPFGWSKQQSIAPAVPKIPPELTRENKNARTVVDQFLKEVRADNLKTAYAMMSPSYREQKSAALFEEEIRQMPESKNVNRYMTILSPGSSPKLSAIEENTGGTKQKLVHFELRKEATWMVESLTVKEVVAK